MKNNIELNSNAVRLRKSWGQDIETPIDVFGLARLQPDITLMSMALSDNISGICARDKEKIVILINSNMSWGRKRFTLAHEFYHCIIEKKMKTYICDKRLDTSKPVAEKEADIFASFFIVPYDALIQYSSLHVDDKWTLENVIEAEQFFQISHQAMLIRLRNQRLIRDLDYEEWKQLMVSQEAIRMGFTDSLYRKSAEDEKFGSTGEYIRKIEKAYKDNLIGESKRRELLLDGFCSEYCCRDTGELIIDD